MVLVHAALDNRKGEEIRPEPNTWLILQAEAAAGGPGGKGGHVAFAGPDVILAVETVDNCAGLSLWTRQDLRRYPFLRLD